MCYRQFVFTQTLQDDIQQATTYGIFSLASRSLKALLTYLFPSSHNNSNFYEYYSQFKRFLQGSFENYILHLIRIYGRVNLLNLLTRKSSLIGRAEFRRL